MKFCLKDLAFECQNPTVLENVEDELKREAAFAKQALTAVAQARRLIIAAKIPFTRPDGYFCEMLKTEEHMSKIGNKISEEKEAAKAAELARKQRLNRKYGKKIQVQREQEKQQIVTENKKKLDGLRKRKREESKDEFDVDVDMEEAMGEERDRKRRGGKMVKTVSKKQQAKDAKYGHGGKKRGAKRNDRDSADKDDFDAGRNRRQFRGLAGSGKSKHNKKQRPGKQRRQNMRSSKASRK